MSRANVTKNLSSGAFWKDHYVVYTDADEIEKNIKSTKFVSAGEEFELIYFETSKGAPNILVSQGSGGHAYVFAELAYLMHRRGYNVFVMPKHGGRTISELVARHADALAHISKTFSDRTAVFGEGLGCFVAFYLALDGAEMNNLACMNGPAVLTEEKFKKAIFSGGGIAAKRRKMLLPFIAILAKMFPWITMPIYTYLDFREMVDTKQQNRKIEEPIVRSFSDDPDFDMRYPLSAVMSLVSTPPPADLSELNVPTMFVVPVRGFFPHYIKDVFSRLPRIKKKMFEVDGGVFWMLSHPADAAMMICDWFDDTL